VRYYAITQPTPNTTTQPQSLTCRTQTAPHLQARTTPPHFPAPHSAPSPACPHRAGHAHTQAPIITTCRCLACLLLAPQPSQPSQPRASTLPPLPDARSPARPLTTTTGPKPCREQSQYNLANGEQGCTCAIHSACPAPRLAGATNTTLHHAA
jgi:hypothetical protein